MPITILAVDDDPGLLFLIQDTLAKEGYDVATADSGAAALAWLERHAADLLLLDLKLSDIEGREFIDAMAAAGRNVPFIIITGQGDERVAVEMMKRGALDYLVKDVNFIEFMPTLVRRGLAQLQRERRLAEAETSLRENAQRLQLALEASDTGTIEVNLLTGEAHWNTVEFGLLGLEPGAAQPGMEAFFRVVHPDDAGRVRGSWEEGIRTGVFDAEFRVVLPDGKERWLSTKGRFGFGGRPVGDEPGRGPATRFLGVNFDITERKRAEQRRRLQYEAARLLSASDSLDETIPRLLQTVAEILKWDVGEFWESAKGSRQLRVGHVWHAPDPALARFVKGGMARSFSLFDGLPSNVLHTGKPGWIEEIADCAHFEGRAEAVAAGLRSALAFPLLLKDQILGVMAFLTRRPTEPDEAVLLLFASLGSQVGQFIERKRLEGEILEIAEREQRRFGYDLHDGLGQRLTGLEMLSHALAEDLAATAPAFAQRARRLSSELRETVTQTRLISHSLAPVPLEGEGLMRGLTGLAASTSRLPGVHCRFLCTPPVVVKDVAVATHLYRIAQEAVNNALKHGRAKRIAIRLEQCGEGLGLVIENNGAPIPAAKRDQSGMGLNIMRYRAGLLGASLLIESGKGRGKGVRVSCTLKRARGPMVQTAPGPV